MNNVLAKLGNIPVTSSIIESLYPQLKGGSQKIRQLEKSGDIIRLKRGLYICNPEISDRPLSTELIANHLYTPSYVSMASALRYYGLIPEMVYTMQSMTLKHSRCFDTAFGRFEYTYIPRKSFSIGLSSIEKDGYAFVMATPEKALCDLIANSPSVNLRSIKDAESYLEEDIRMEMDDFLMMNVNIFEEYAKTGKKSESIRTLIKLLNNDK